MRFWYIRYRRHTIPLTFALIYALVLPFFRTDSAFSTEVFATAACVALGWIVWPGNDEGNPLYHPLPPPLDALFAWGLLVGPGVWLVASG